MGRSKGAKGDNRGGRGESGPSIQVNQDDPSKSDQIRSNQTKSDQKNGPARIQAQALGSKLARTKLDLGRARWMQTNAERMNENAKDLSDRNTCFICDTAERGLGLEEEPLLFSLNGRKNVERRC